MVKRVGTVIDMLEQVVVETNVLKSRRRERMPVRNNTIRAMTPEERQASIKREQANASKKS